MNTKRFAIVTAIFHEAHNERNFKIPSAEALFAERNDDDEWALIIFTDIFTTYFASLSANDFPCHARFYDTQSLSHGISYYDDFHCPELPNCLERNQSVENRLNFIKWNLHRLPQLQQFEHIVWMDYDHDLSCLPTSPSDSPHAFMYDRNRDDHTEYMEHTWRSIMAGEDQSSSPRP